MTIERLRPQGFYPSEEPRTPSALEFSPEEFDGEAIGGYNFHDFQRSRFTGATTCAKCGLMPMDEEDAETPCVA